MRNRIIPLKLQLQSIKIRLKNSKCKKNNQYKYEIISKYGKKYWERNWKQRNNMIIRIWPWLEKGDRWLYTSMK